jgi:hypothetical protein
MPESRPPPSHSEAHAARVIRLCEERGEFVTDLDGFVVWWQESNTGVLSAADLRTIAAELDRRNAPWTAQLDAYSESSNA